MIKLSKLNLPPELAAKITDRTQRYQDLVAAGEPVPDSLSSAYKAAEVKVLLRTETADKCAYCESKIPHVDYGDVEHLLPKSVFPHLRYTYGNLTYACGVCNTRKGDFYSAETPLLNPYEDHPGEHLIPIGPMVMRSPASDRGLLTEKKLALNRTELVERRMERLEAVATLVDQVARTENPVIRSVLVEQIEKECRDDKEYAFVVRAFVASSLERVD